MVITDKPQSQLREVERFRAAHRHIVSTFWNQFVSFNHEDDDLDKDCGGEQMNRYFGAADKVPNIFVFIVYIICL